MEVLLSHTNSIVVEYSLFVCLVKGSVVVLHGCLTNRIPKATHPIPCPEGVLSEVDMNSVKDSKQN